MLRERMGGYVPVVPGLPVVLLRDHHLRLGNWGSLIQCHRWPSIGTAPYDQITAPAGAVFLGAHRANYPGNRSWAKSRPASPSKARVSLTPTPPALSPKGIGIYTARN